MFTDDIHTKYSFPISTKDAMNRKNPAYKSGHASSVRAIRPATYSGANVDPCRDWSSMHTLPTAAKQNNKRSPQKTADAS